MSTVDETHDPRRTSWVASAQGHGEFPIQNLPFGVFSPAGGAPRGGVAIGDQILDLRAALELGLLSSEAAVAAEAASGSSSLRCAPRVEIQRDWLDAQRLSAPSRILLATRICGFHCQPVTCGASPALYRTSEGASSKAVV